MINNYKIIILINDNQFNRSNSEINEGFNEAVDKKRKDLMKWRNGQRNGNFNGGMAK